MTIIDYYILLTIIDHQPFMGQWQGRMIQAFRYWEIVQAMHLHVRQTPGWSGVLLFIFMPRLPGPEPNSPVEDCLTLFQPHGTGRIWPWVKVFDPQNGNTSCLHCGRFRYPPRFVDRGYPRPGLTCQDTDAVEARHQDSWQGTHQAGDHRLSATTPVPSQWQQPCWTAFSEGSVQSTRSTASSGWKYLDPQWISIAFIFGINT